MWVRGLRISSRMSVHIKVLFFVFVRCWNEVYTKYTNILTACKSKIKETSPGRSVSAGRPGSSLRKRSVSWTQLQRARAPLVNYTGTNIHKLALPLCLSTTINSRNNTWITLFITQFCRFNSAGHKILQQSVEYIIMSFGY